MYVNYVAILSSAGIGHDSEADIEEIPAAVPRGDFKPVKFATGEPTYIMMDLETTDLSKLKYSETGVY